MRHSRIASSWQRLIPFLALGLGPKKSGAHSTPVSAARNRYIIHCPPFTL